MGHLLFGPGDEALALGLEVLAQVFGVAAFGEHRLLLRAHVQIHQGHVNVRQLLLLTQQPAIHLGLRPVQVAVRCGLAVQPPFEGLDLVDALLRGVIAIGPAAHAQGHQEAADLRGRGGARQAPDFTGLGKIAALGIKVSRHRTYHGVALNVAMDLEPYQRINPCGYAGLQSIDLSTIGVQTTWEEVAGVLGKQLTVRLAP